MQGEQLSLWPELSPFYRKEKNIDWVDISTLPDDPNRKPERQCSNLPPNKYIIFKTGGSNLYYPNEANIFPYVKNLHKGNQVPAKGHGGDGYPRIGIVNKKGDGINFKIHRLAALAFLENPENKLIVGHINDIIVDYRLSNLKWLTISENSKGTARGKQGVLTGTYGEVGLAYAKKGNGL